MPFTITYTGGEKAKNEKTILLLSATVKKPPETTRMLVVVRGCSKRIPIARTKATVIEVKLPKLKSNWLSLSCKL